MEGDIVLLENTIYRPEMLIAYYEKTGWNAQCDSMRIENISELSDGFIISEKNYSKKSFRKL